MSLIATERLLLVPLSHAVIRRRLEAESFRLAVEGVGIVTFPANWPGDALAFFETLLRTGPDPVDGSFVAVERVHLVAVGMLGSIGVAQDGELEIGYGFGVEGRGYATESVRALVEALSQAPDVRRIVASTAVVNVASQRVLEKCGFERTGTSFSQDDGDLFTWTWI